MRSKNYVLAPKDVFMVSDVHEDKHVEHSS